MSKKIGIVVITYNRPKSLQRLLDSLNSVRYSLNDTIDLIISIDKTTNTEVYKKAEDFEFQFGKKIILKRPENLGLKRHVLECGNLTKNYDALIVLEDDLIVSKEMYSYTIECLKEYGNNEKIAGISLYTHRRNFHNDIPFTPLNNNHSVFFMQIAQSWGQVWTEKMWEKFLLWYEKNNTGETLHQCGKFPSTISNWSDKSWLKYQMKYLFDNDLYFVYPYESITSNFTEAGTHNNYGNNNYQVPLAHIDCEEIRYSFPKEFSDGIRYDIFFENINLKEYLNDEYENIEIDLYGLKYKNKNLENNNIDYLLTLSSLPYKIENCYGLNLRPIENNIFRNITGQAISVYNLKMNSPKSKLLDEFLIQGEKIEYFYQFSSIKLLLKFITFKLFLKFSRIINRGS